ncbi:toll-like receptor 9 [Alosa sapidissima]|uniref:toll-like receptor 9 n=1 Tax=Alosa sapidissima TaxID=34773 RepID=UPI001C09A269|nr:toll-like receptor 9 [Alosa sapidissima]
MDNILIPILAWLLVPAVMSIDTKFFPCENDLNETIVDCTGRDFTSVPKIRSLKVLSLNLNHNKIRIVGSNAFSGVPNLINLTMMWNCAPGRYKNLGIPLCTFIIDSNAFMKLERLQTLHLTGNSLTTIPALPKSLQVLNLEYNNLFKLTEPLGTPNLTHLLLTKNCFYANPCNNTFVIKEDVLKELPKLKFLHLGFNNISKVPTGLPNSLTNLDLRENKITKIPSNAFSNLRKLSTLNLAWNCQRCDHAAEPCYPCPGNKPLILYNNTFYDQSNSLRNLSLRGNSLRTLPPGLFAYLRKLVTLDLSDNLLAYTISNGTFYQHLSSVKNLNLMYNYEPLKSFDSLVLSPLLASMAHLESLSLNGYFFRSFSPKTMKILANLPNLRYLDLRSNFISSCSMSAFQHFKSLRKVVLSQNLLDFIPLCKQKNEEWQSEPQGPSAVNRRNRRKDSQYEDDSEFESLLKNTPVNYDRIWPNLTMQNFYKMLCSGQLTFDLSYNNILTINSSVFIGMEKVVCLDMSFNYMSLKPNGQQFSSLKGLSYFNLAHNRVDLYFREAFQELQDTLKVLDLSNNAFSFLMMGIGHNFTFLRKLTSLEALSLDDNQIGYRVSNLFSASLKYLYFAGNRLDIMWGSSDQYSNFFQGLTNLVHLDISRNQLRSVLPEALICLPKTLLFLRVDSNQLNFFPWDNITELPELRYLNLSGNYLTILPDRAVDVGRNFSGLDLSHNSITALPEKFFSKMTTLVRLLLNNNQLKVLDAWGPPTPLRDCRALKDLTLQANPFTCSCATSWFVEYLRTTNISIPHLTTTVRCGFPESLQGENILNIDPRSCQEIWGGFAFLCSSILTIILTVFPLLKQLYGWDLWYCFQVLWAGHKGYSQFRGSSEAEHDAFVVFDTSNLAVRDWVYNELVDNLENKGKWRFKLCLEERDWVPGVSCIENLHNAVHNSRKTVFVLTNPGARCQVSGVIRQAFLLVQQRLLDEKVDVAVLVLLDTFFHKFKYLQMRKRLCRKSVISWPRNPLAQPVFWNQLRGALAVDNVGQYDKKVTGSFLTD